MPTAKAAALPFRRPLPWITVALAGGILLASMSGTLVLYALPLLLLITISSAIVVAITKQSLWLFLTLFALAFALGYLRYHSQDSVASNDVSNLAGAEVQLRGTVESSVQEMYSSSEAHSSRARLTVCAHSATTIADNHTYGDVTGYVEVSLPISAIGTNNAVVLPQYGDVLSLQGDLELPAGPRNPGAFDEQKMLARHGIFSRITVKLPLNWQIEATAGTDAGILRPIFWLREQLLSHGRHVLSRERAGVLNAILVGAKSELSPADRTLFEKTGTVHLLATAGLHTGLVVAMLLYLLPFAGLPRRTVAVVTLVLLVVFTIMAGDRPAVVRAAVMGAVYLFGLLLEREPDLPNAIALAALGLLLANPFNLFDFGFQISFATVITLALGMKLTLPLRRFATRRISRHGVVANVLHGAVDYMATCLCVTVIAQIGSMPLIIYYFNIFTPAGLVANLLIVPIVAPVIAVGFAASALGAVTPFPLLSLPLDWILNAATTYILTVVRVCSGPHFGVTSIGSPPAWLIIIYYLMLWVWLGWWRARIKS